MIKKICAVYENGVFRPVDKVDLPEGCEVEVAVRTVSSQTDKPSLDDVYKVLSKRFDTGETDMAARHNEHQP